MAGELAIRTRGLSKAYRGRPAVRDLDLEVPAGSVFGFLGVNGAGKSTTMRMLTGLVWSDAGEALLLGEPVSPRRTAALARVGVMIEGPAFYGDWSARRNLELLASLSGGVPREEVDWALARTGLADRAGDPVRAFSHGMRQRLGIAQALLPRPRLLVLDEPSDGLDPGGMREMRELLRSLASELGLTVFLSSHLLAEVQALCDRVAVVHEGRLRFQGTVAELRRRGGEGLSVTVEVDRPDEAARSLASVPGVAILSNAEGRLEVAADREAVPAIASALTGAGLRVYRLAPRELTLEEAFFRLLEEAP